MNLSALCKIWKLYVSDQAEIKPEVSEHPYFLPRINLWAFCEVWKLCFDQAEIKPKASEHPFFLPRINLGAFCEVWKENLSDQAEIKPEA